MESLIKLSDVIVSSSDRNLLNIKSLSISQGEKIAVVGANGAGKTTFLESILGLRELKQGKVDLKFHKNQLGVQLQNSTYHPDFLVSDIIKLHRSLYRNINNTLYEQLSIDEIIDHKYSRLSRGQKQRVDIYIAFAHDPRVLIIDEPGTGLDRNFRDQFFSLLSDCRKNPVTTLLMASHTAAEIDQTTHVLWLLGGEIKEFGTRESVIDQYIGSFKAHLRYESSSNLDNEIDKLLKASGFRYLRRLSEREFIVYGDESLRQPMLELASRYEFYTFSLTTTDTNDFLNLVSAISLDTN